MSIWGKIIGGAAGFALGGPIGGLVGALAGHAVDHYVAEPSPDPSGHEVAFTIALVALAAKMAKVDGVVSKDEILAFRQKVDIPVKDLDNVSRLWDLARQTPDGFDGYARQLAGMFPPASPIFDQLMELLFFIARADGSVTEIEKTYLSHVARILGYDEIGFEKLCLVYGDPLASPYHILGAQPEDNDQTIRNAWLELARSHHPDKLMAAGLPEEFIRAATERLTKINAAYENIMQTRKDIG